MIHEAARLPEIDILSILADFRNRNSIQFATCAKTVQNIADQGFKRSRAGQAGAGDNTGDGVDIHAPKSIAQLGNFGCHTTDQALRVSLLVFSRQETVKFHTIKPVAFRHQANNTSVIQCRTAKNIHIYAGTKHMTVLMVGVVAAYLCPARTGDKNDFCIFCCVKCFPKAFDDMQYPGSGKGEALLRTIQRIKCSQFSVLSA